jgi:uncharacterized protein (DUF58 family)
MFTTRFFLLFMACPGLLILSAFAGGLPFLVPLALAYGGGLAALLWLDRRAAGSSGQFVIARLHDQKLSLGAPNKIALQITSRASRSVEAHIYDEPPYLFEGATDAQGQITVGPRETTTLDYYVRPLKRGDFAFGGVNLRWPGPLNFWIRLARYPLAETVKVYPNLHDIQKYDLLVRRDQLAEMGLRNVRLRGEGTTFESLRDYTPDDPYRAINWKATARRGKPISTEYEPERSQRVVVVVDVGRMMRSTIRAEDPSGASWDMAKVDYVINAVLLFSYVATLRGDQVGLLVFADKVGGFIPPAAGKTHFQKLLDAMYALESQPVEADYARAVNYLSAQNKKRSLVVMFTDLSGERASEALLANLPRLTPRHLPLLVTIRDPALDHAAHERPTDSAAVYRRAVAEQLIDERRLTLDNLSRRGVLTLDVVAQQLSMAVINKYLQLKATNSL